MSVEDNRADSTEPKNCVVDRKSFFGGREFVF